MRWLCLWCSVGWCSFSNKLGVSVWTSWSPSWWCVNEVNLWNVAFKMLKVFKVISFCWFTGFYQYKWIRPPAFLRGPASITTCQLCVILFNKSSAVAEMGDRDNNRYGPKRGGGCYAPLTEAGTPSNTMWPGPRPISMPSAIMIHPAVLPQ